LSTVVARATWIFPSNCSSFAENVRVPQRVLTPGL
jgi:hypothetical protein